MIQLAILSAVLASALGNGRGGCPNSMGKYPFDIQKMSGQWIMIASTHAGIPDGVTCAKFTYHPPLKNVTTIGVSAVKVRDGTPWKAEILWQPLYGKRKSASGLSVRIVNAGMTSPVYMESIVATDYDNYAVTMACTTIFNEETKSFGRILEVHIISRNTNISVETLNVLKNFVSGYHVDPQTINLVESVEC